MILESSHAMLWLVSHTCSAKADFELLKLETAPKRQFCTRLKEHQRAVSNFNSSKSALAEHVCETSHTIAWEDSRIITTNNRYGQRLCLEAWHINASPCALNRDDGSHLPKEYLHLVGR